MIVETIAAIEARLIAILQAKPELYDPTNTDPTKRGLTSPSQVAAWRSFLFTIATEISVMQNLMSTFETEVEAFIALAAPAIPLWVQDRVFKFQYSATNPQVVVLDLTTFVPAYPVIDETLRIVSRCSVKTDTNKTVKIKVATGSTPAALSAPQITALNAYLDTILPAGVGKNLISLTSDKLWLDAQIYFNGQYSTVIQANVIAALDAFLAAIPFDGVVKISAIEDAIQAVAGVTDVVIDEVRARDNATAFGGAITVVKDYETFAGYIVQETTSGQTFADTLTFIPE